MIPQLLDPSDVFVCQQFNCGKAGTGHGVLKRSCCRCCCCCWRRRGWRHHAGYARCPGNRRQCSQFAADVIRVHPTTKPSDVALGYAFLSIDIAAAVSDRDRSTADRPYRNVLGPLHSDQVSIFLLLRRRWVYSILIPIPRINIFYKLLSCLYIISSSNFLLMLLRNTQIAHTRLPSV